MRSGGAGNRGAWSRFVALLVATSVVFIGATGPANAAPKGLASHLWALTRDPQGHLHVVRGSAAAAAVAEDRAGATATQVVSYEEDEPVHLLGDPLRSEQWALDAVPYESTWS